MERYLVKSGCFRQDCNENARKTQRQKTHVRSEAPPRSGLAAQTRDHNEGRNQRRPVEEAAGKDALILQLSALRRDSLTSSVSRQHLILNPKNGGQKISQRKHFKTHTREECARLDMQSVEHNFSKSRSFYASGNTFGLQSDGLSGVRLAGAPNHTWGPGV